MVAWRTLVVVLVLVAAASLSCGMLLFPQHLVRHSTLVFPGRAASGYNNDRPKEQGGIHTSDQALLVAAGRNE